MASPSSLVQTINLPDEVVVDATDDDTGVDEVEGIAEEGPVIFVRVNFEEKYVTDIDELRDNEPLMPRKYAETADGPIDRGKVILFETEEGIVLPKSHAYKSCW
jgi:hypothetical protein